MNKRVVFLTEAAVVAALYVVLTVVANALNLSTSPIQVRFSEALTILPYFTPAAVPGLSVGCVLANLLTGAALPDIVFGSLATLLGALGSYALRSCKWLVPLPPVLANTIIVPFILRYGYGISGPLWYFALTVGIGEIISCYLLGMLLLLALKKIDFSRF